MEKRFKGGVETPFGGVSFHSENEEARNYIWLVIKEKNEREHGALESAIQKPPLGLMPRHVWKYKRTLEIMRAIIRYDDAGLMTNIEWREELRGLVAESKPKDQRPGQPIDNDNLGI